MAVCHLRNQPFPFKCKKNKKPSVFQYKRQTRIARLEYNNVNGLLIKKYQQMTHF